MPLFAAKGMSATGGGGAFYTLLESKQDTADNSSYRQPSGMFDVATSSSGEVYTLNGERNVLTGLYNVVVAKIGAIGAVSWQYTLSAASNIYPQALACDTRDNSIIICCMKTTTLSGVGNYSNKKTEDGNPGYADNTNDAQYHVIKFSSSGTRLWENTWSSANPTNYPAAICKRTPGGAFQYANTFENRNEGTSEVYWSKQGAPDLKLMKVRSDRGKDFNGFQSPFMESVHETNGGQGRSTLQSDTFRVLGQDFTGEQEVHQAFALDGPLFGGRPQSTSNIVIDQTNDYWYLMVAANATTDDLSRSRSTFQVLRGGLNGTSVNAKEMVYPGGWDQNARITLDSSNNLLIPWTGTNKERLYRAQTLNDYSQLCDVGDTAHHVDISNTAANIRLDWDNDEFDLTYYSLNGNAPCKVCKVEADADGGTTYEYVTTAGLTPAPNIGLGMTTASRANSRIADGANRSYMLGRYTNLVQLHKRNKATNALDWIKTFFAIPRGPTRDANATQNSGSNTDWKGGLGTPDISVADSKVHPSGVYYLGNVVMPQEGIEHTSTPFTSKLSYFGFVAKVSHDGEVEYIREIRGLDTLDQAGSPSTKPPHHYAAREDGGVLLDSINFDAFNNMIVTGRSIDAQQVGNVGTWVNNVIFKLPHNGDLIGPIEINDDHNQQVQRFSYTPAVCVRSWEDVKYDTQIAYGSGMETFKLLRTCALWNTTNQAPTSPTSLGSVTTQANYEAFLGSNPSRLVQIDTGTYTSRMLWQTPTTNLQLDTTQNRQFDRAKRRSSSSVFLQVYEETAEASRIEAVRSCPAYLYVDQAVNTDNARSDYDVSNYTKPHAEGDIQDTQEIKKQEAPNGMITVSQYWDGDTGLRKQLLTRHSPTGGVEARLYDMGVNTYPKDVCIDEIGNIYTVGWAANTIGGNTYGVGYITAYDKNLVFLWDAQYVNTDSSSLGDAAENYQIHCCAVTMTSANTAKLFIGGHHTTVSSNTPSQLASINVIPMDITNGLPSYTGMSVSGANFSMGGGHPNQQIDGIFGLDVFQADGGDGNNCYVGYAGKTYDTTGTTTRGMYGIIRYNGNSPLTGAGDKWGYVTGDDLELSSFAFCKGLDSYHSARNSHNAFKYAVGGSDTAAGTTNGVVIVATSLRTTGGSISSQNDQPYSFTSMKINNSNGADIVRDLRWGYVEQPGLAIRGSTDNRAGDAGGNEAEDQALDFIPLSLAEDRLFVACSVTNQFSQIDSYMIEITSASNSYQSGITGNRIADGINITRVGKVSTSGITDPAGIVALGPAYGTVMMSCNAAQSGTPNDRQLLTVKVPFDMSKKRSLYHNVGSLSINWSQPDFSFAVNGVSSYPGALGAYATAANNDGTRFYHGTTSFVGGWAAGGGTNVGDVSVAGTFTVLTQDLQQFKQS